MIHVTIEISNGHLPNIENFERGRVDTFTVETTDLGDITSVSIGHDACGNFPQW
jgi:hypothetical protein